MLGGRWEQPCRPVMQANKGSQWWSRKRDTGVKGAGYEQRAIPCDLVSAICLIGCEPGQCRVSDAEFSQSGEEDLVVQGVERSR